VRQPSTLKLTLFFVGPVLLAAFMLGFAAPGSAVVLSLVAGVLWLGPAAAAVVASRRATTSRAAYVTAAIVATFPFVAGESWIALDTLRSFNGFCRHAPDIAYPCSLPRSLGEAMLPSSPFALFGILLVGILASLWGLIALLLAVGFDRLRRWQRRRAPASAD